MNQVPHNNINNNKKMNEILEQLTQRLEILNLRQQDIQRQSFEVWQHIQTIQQAQRRGTTAAPQARTQQQQQRDKHNKTIDVGDYVNFLINRRNNTRSGTITQISHQRFVSARDRTGRIISREPSNMEIVQKYNSDHDQHRRYK